MAAKKKVAAKPKGKPAPVRKAPPKKPLVAKAPPEKRGRGRPSLFTAAIAAEIVDRISSGEPLAQICRSAEMPAQRTVYDWLEADEHFSARFARAREAGFDVIAADALRIADTPIAGVVEKMGVDEKGGLQVVERRVEDMLGHRRLQIETRLKLLAKWDPKRYGDKLELGSNPDNPIPAASFGVILIPSKGSDGSETAG